MLRSALFIKTSKTPPADADSVNARLLSQAGFVHKQMAGVYSYLPLGLRVIRNIERIIRAEMNALGAQEILMPALTQTESYDKTGRASLDILYHVTAQNADMILNLSHEEVVTPLLQRHIFSYRDLPAAVYQIQTKFRNEPRAKSGLLRGREFPMKDLYSFHATSEDLEAYHESVRRAYMKIFREAGVADYTVYTYASGGSFSKYSNEFQALCDVGEDTIFVCSRCIVAVNKEIINRRPTCPECGNAELAEKKSIEIGNIFKLGAKFSDVFGLRFADQGGAEHPVLMGCYGIGLSRLMGTAAELHHDDRGIIWPARIAPFDVHVVGLDMDKTAVSRAARALYDRLVASGIEALFDDRSDVSAGEKLAEADLFGIPWRAIVSRRTGRQIEVKKRSELQSRNMSVREMIQNIRPAGH